LREIEERSGWWKIQAATKLAIYGTRTLTARNTRDNDERNQISQVVERGDEKLMMKDRLNFNLRILKEIEIDRIIIVYRRIVAAPTSSSSS
jgi:hypothetical protein